MKTIFTIDSIKLFIFLLLSGNLLQGNLQAQTIAGAYRKDPVVNINLMLPSGDSTLLVDGTAAMYDNKFSPEVDQYDANKLNNFWENICLWRNGDNLAIEARPMPKQNDTLFINMWGLRRPVYELQISVTGIAAMLASRAWLIDNYKHTQTPVSFLSKTLYKFSFTADSNSYEKRFMLVFDNGQQNIQAFSTGNVIIFPNPVSGNKLSLQFKGMSKDNYSVSLSSLSGEILLKTSIVHNGGNGTYYIPLKSVLIKGMNTLTVYSSDGKNIIHLPVILNN